MHIMWRGLELPGRVVRDENVSNESYARFIIEPFEQGFGTTIGNSLRRVLLSSLEGAAITTVKIEGVSHEFSSIEGVLEDVTEILLNVKDTIIAYDGVEPKTITVQRESPGEVRAGDMVTDSTIRIANPDHLIATITGNAAFRAEFQVETGRGYATASDNRSAEQEIGIIAVDSVFSPVRRVRYRTEEMRVGQQTNYDRLILEVWTNGTFLPEEALVEAGMILRKHLTPFVMYSEYGSDSVPLSQPLQAESNDETDAAMAEFLEKPIAVLNLSVRAANCLEAAKITLLRELVSHTEPELLRFRSFGKTSLVEVVHKLGDVGLTLGMFRGTDTLGEPPGAGTVLGGDSESGTMSVDVPAAGVVGESQLAQAPQEQSMADASPPGDDSADPAASAGAGPMAAYTNTLDD